MMYDIPPSVLGHVFCRDCLRDFEQQMARSGFGRLAIQYRPDDGMPRSNVHWITLRPQMWKGSSIIPARG